jgi:hypothetical protein
MGGETNNSRRRVTLGRVGWIVGLATAGMLAAVVARPLPSAGDEAKGALPADLQGVPSDAVAMLSVRVADLWNQDAAKALRDKVTTNYPDALEQGQKLIGAAPADIERLTLVFAEFVEHSEPIPLVFVATQKPYDKTQVLAAVAPGAKEERRKERTLYVGGKEGERGVTFLGDRAYVVSTADEVRSYLERPVPKKEGRLAGALRLAAEKHAAVLGINPEQIAKVADEHLEPEAEPFRPLLKTESATLVLDLGEEVRGEARLTYAAPKDAREAEKALRVGLDMSREALAKGLEELAKQPKGATNLLGVAKQLQTALKDATVEQTGKDVALAARFKPDLTSVGLAVAEAVEKTRGAAGRLQSQNNLKQIALASINYADTYMHLPAQAIFGKDGKPLLSWRVSILPYIEQDALFKEFHLDEPWDSEHNKRLLARIPPVFAMPGSRKGSTDTYYLSFVGPGAYFEGKKGLRFPAEFTDGTSNTIMVVEAAQGVPWTKPEDLPFDPNKPLPKLGGHFPGGFNAALCDGSVRFLRDTISQETLKAAITRNGGEVLGSDF